MNQSHDNQLELSGNKADFIEAYEGMKIVDFVTHKYLLIPESVKEVYLLFVLSKMADMGFRSAIIFASNLSTCNQLNLLLKFFDKNTSTLHSYYSLSGRLSALDRIKSGQHLILLATDGASRGLDIPNVDLVINYDIPRDSTDYAHRTAGVGGGGMALSMITEKDVDLIIKIEAALGKKLQEFECKESEALADLTKVFKAKRLVAAKEDA